MSGANHLIVKDYIRTLLASQRAEIAEKVEGITKDPVKAFGASGREGDIALLETLAYNQALSDFQALLKDEK